MVNEVRVDSWSAFDEAIEEYVRVPALMGSFAFRGQSNAKWTLEPTLLRLTGSYGPGEIRVHNIESRIVDYFMARASNYVTTVPDAGDDLPEWWVLMQHYGVPTRLLDWTLSPYVAAYFAVQEPDNTSDGALYFVNYFGVVEAVYDLKPSRGKLGDINFRSMLWKTDIDPQPWIWFSKPERMTDRMVAQQGIYSICISPLRDHGEEIMRVIPDDMQRYFGRIIIPNELKREFALRLHHMNINATSLFPGIDGLGRGIRELVALEVQTHVNLLALLRSDPLFYERDILPLLDKLGMDPSKLEGIDVSSLINRGETFSTFSESIQETLSWLKDLTEEEE